jgi:transposase InsO family protein
MEEFYASCGVTRQAVHQYRRRHEAEQVMMVEIEVLIMDYRANKDRRAGSRSLFYNLDIKSRFGIGVSKFERLMSQYELTLAPLRLRVVTTKSCLQSWNYKNLIYGLDYSDINELVVGDLTYVQLGRHRYYLFCLTDVYSARIVGYSFYKRMRSEEARLALHRWIALRGADAVAQCIHHTDGGTQYFSGKYIGDTKTYKLRVSVARSCLDNGHAEQRNGFIKQHLLPLIRYTEEPRVYKEVDRILNAYNVERQQQNLGWRSPVEYEQALEQGLIDREVKRMHDPEIK